MAYVRHYYYSFRDCKRVYYIVVFVFHIVIRVLTFQSRFKINDEQVQDSAQFHSSNEGEAPLYSAYQIMYVLRSDSQHSS